MTTSVVDWLTPVFEGAPEPEPAHHLSHLDDHRLSSVGVTVLGARIWRGRCSATAPRCRSSRPARWSPRPASNLYGDAFNEAVFEKPGKYLTRALVYFDNKGIDGLVNGLAAAVGGGSGRLRRAQTGFVRSYALSMLGGALLVAVAFFFVRLG